MRQQRISGYRGILLQKSFCTGDHAVLTGEGIEFDHIDRNGRFWFADKKDIGRSRDVGGQWKAGCKLPSQDVPTDRQTRRARTFRALQFYRCRGAEHRVGRERRIGKRYRLDQQLRSTVSGKAGHKDEFLFCHETRQPMMPQEGVVAPKMLHHANEEEG